MFQFTASLYIGIDIFSDIKYPLHNNFRRYKTMQYDYKEVEVRQFRRRNRLTGIESTVSVSNRNDLSVEEHIRLLNLNDPDFEYMEVIDPNEASD